MNHGGTFIDIFWLFFMFSALQPVLRQRMLEAMRMRKIASLERKRSSRVILLVHRQETMRLLGFPIMRYIDVDDSEEVLRAIQMTDDDAPLDIILHTPGGLVLAALQIASAIRSHKAKVTVFVPHYAMSGGTLISLAAQEIVMSRHAVLGPIDPQLGQFPAASLLKVVEQKPIAEIDDETLIMADVARKAIAQVKKAARLFLNDRVPEDQAEALAEKMSTGTWTHGHPISASEARELGLPVTTDMPTEVFELMTLYPSPSARRSVPSSTCPCHGRRNRHGRGDDEVRLAAPRSHNVWRSAAPSIRSRRAGGLLNGQNVSQAAVEGSPYLGRRQGV
jgi:ClpP class serine protease